MSGWMSSGTWDRLSLVGDSGDMGDRLPNTPGQVPSG